MRLTLKLLNGIILIIELTKIRVIVYYIFTGIMKLLNNNHYFN